MNNREISFLSVFLCIVITGSVFLSGCTTPDTPVAPGVPPQPAAGNESYTIGAIYNLEGSEATFDIPSMQGAKLAVQEINEQGGINGKPLELVVADGKSNTSMVVQGVSELTADGKKSVIIGLSNPDHALPAAQAAASAGVCFVTSGATSPRLPSQVPGNVYLACMGDNTQAAVGAEFAAGTLSAKNAYLLYESDKEYPTLLAGYFKTRFMELNGTVLKTDTFNSIDHDFSSHLANLSALHPQPDIIMVSAQTWAEAKPVIEAIRNAGFQMPVMGGDGYDSPSLLTGDATGIDNIYYTTHTWFDPSTTNEKQRNFMTRYREEYNSSAVPFAGLGYDTVMIVSTAIRSNGSTGTFPEGMANLSQYTGVTGTLTYPGNSHIPQKAVTMMRISNGTPVHVGDFMPASVPSP